MSLYDRYSKFLGTPYVEGLQDCYGLLRRYAKENYNLELSNYARPGDFAHAGLDLIMDYFIEEEFQLIETNLNNLEIGDVLLMRINNSPLCNHIGIYVGNHMFIHHLFSGMSKEDPLNTRWKSRVMSVVRHPEISRQNALTLEKFNFMDVVNPNALPPAN